MLKDTTLTAEVAEALQKIGIEAIVTVHGRTVRLEGVVEATGLRQAAADIVTALDPAIVVDNELEVIPILPVPDELEGDADVDPMTAMLRIVDEETAEDDRESRQSTSGADEAWGEDPGTAAPYFPPTDPVIRTSHGDVDLLGGFAETSLDEIGDGFSGRSQSARRGRGDEEIADDVRQELAEDAATTDLRIRVRVTNGIVHLRGLVPTIDDAESAEEVARRVHGVVDVDEGLAVTWT